MEHNTHVSLQNPALAVVETLKSEFSQRITRRKLYSMRAFARDLELDTGHLNQVLQLKRGLSLRSAEVICQRLGWSTEFASHFEDLVVAAWSRNPREKAVAKQRIASYVQRKQVQYLSPEDFEMVSQWHYLAILECCELSGFISNTQNICQKLGLPEGQIQSCLDRLLRLGMVKREKGVWQSVQEYSSTLQDVPQPAVRNFHSSMLEKSETALKTLPVAEREFQSVIFSIDPERFEELKSKIRSSCLQILREFGEDANRSELVTLNLQTYPLSREHV